MDLGCCLRGHLVRFVGGTLVKEPFTKEDLAELDRRNMRLGQTEEWMLSDYRKEVAGPNNVVRIISWNNIDEVAYKADMDVHKLSAAYQEALQTDDILFVTYEEKE